MNIKDVLDQIGQDVLTEETKKLLSDAFAEAVKAQTQESLTLEMTNALQTLDKEHAEKLEKLLEAIDIDHTKKLESVIESIDSDHTEKLKYLIEKHNKEIKEDATKFKGDLVTQLSNYLEVYVDKAIPAAELKEAVENKQAQKILAQIKEVVAVDEQFVNETIRTAVADGKQAIDGLKSELTEAIKSNIQLNNSLKTSKAELVLEKATAQFPKEKKAFVLRVLKDKDPEYITENLSYVVKMFDKNDDENKTILTEKAIKPEATVSGNVAIPQSKIKDTSLVTESAVPGDTDGVSEYLGALKTQDRFKK